MPNIVDATVTPNAYDTSGNGGRKLVMLENGWLVSAVKSGETIYFYKSIDNGNTWTQYHSVVGTVATNVTTNVSISHSGNVVYALIGAYTSTHNRHFEVWTLNLETNTNSFVNLEPIALSGVGSGSIIVNNEGTELHATWSSKGSTYPNSFNIRYTKGTINADGSVTWGSVEQVTKNNNLNGQGIQNPSIVLYNDVPIIFAETYSIRFNDTGTGVTNGYHGLIAIKNSTELISYPTYFNSNWTYKNLSPDSTYTQSSPSAIFVPQSVNGLSNGRIEVAWHGLDSIDNSRGNIRYSYSDDGGVTWSAMQKLTSGNAVYSEKASLSANKNGDIFVTFTKGFASNTDSLNVAYMKKTSGSWGSVVQVTNYTSTQSDAWNASSIYDLELNHAVPLTIYEDKENGKVGFYGSWIITEISTPEGDLGQKTSGNNLLTYNITSEEGLTTITEKVNGAVIGTKNIASGVNTTVDMTQGQWDEVKFGKCQDTLGNENTLTIEMGDNVWRYTFEKTLPVDADILSIVKAVQDVEQIKMPMLKQILVDKIGGDVTSPFDNLIEGGLYGKKWASGTAVTDTSRKITITGLEFNPAFIIWDSPTYNRFGFFNKESNQANYLGWAISDGDNASRVYSKTGVLSVGGFSLVSDSGSNRTIYWWAFE